MEKLNNSQIKNSLQTLVNTLHDSKKELARKDPIDGNFLSNSLYGEIAGSNADKWFSDEVEKLIEQI